MSIPTNKIVCADVLGYLRGLPDNCVHCCVTSPPYWGLRDYGVDGQLGLEKTPEEYVAKMVEVFSEVRRVLRDDGTLWLNLGDSYAGSGKGAWDVTDMQKEVYVPKPGGLEASIPKVPSGLKPKDLCGIPWRVAFALQADGWWLRSEIIWAKPNPMPESVTDRPTKAHEQIFLLTKSARYFYDAEAVKEKVGESTRRASTFRNGGDYTGGNSFNNSAKKEKDSHGDGALATGRNLRTVWTIATEAYPECHFATFPTALVNKCIMAGTSERGCCPTCGKPWQRVVEKTPMVIERSGRADEMGEYGRTQSSGTMVDAPKSKTIGFKPGCDCGVDPVPCVVLDPFVGSGTTAYRAREMGRNFLACDLNPEYIKLADKRTAQGVLI